MAAEHKFESLPAKGSQEELDELVDAVYESLKDSISDILERKIEVGDIITITAQIMKIVERYPISGDTKKMVVIAVLKSIVEDQRERFGLSESDLAAINGAIEFIVPGAIDVIVGAASGLLRINYVSLWGKIKRAIADLRKCCCGSG